jgi:hypothetical protein
MLEGRGVIDAGVTASVAATASLGARRLFRVATAGDEYESPSPKKATLMFLLSSCPRMSIENVRLVRSSSAQHPPNDPI